MARTATRRKGMLVAKEAIVVNVGARPVEYRKIMVTDRRTGERVEILDTDNDPIDEGDEGVPYAFKAFQRVNPDHPAVKANPDAFMPADEVDEVDQEPEA
jgi:hypothetical protein